MIIINFILFTFIYCNYINYINYNVFKLCNINISIIFIAFNKNKFISCNSFPLLQKRFNSIEEITFISVPFPVSTKNIFMSLLLSVSSWLSISPKSRVILFINRNDLDYVFNFSLTIEKIFGKDRISYPGTICTNWIGLPYINEWFIQGLRLCQSRYVCFLNSDIFLPSNWLKITEKVFLLPSMLNTNLFLISKRINFHLNETIFNSINFTKYILNHKDLLKEMEMILLKDKNITYSRHSAVDIFTFRADRPPFNPKMIPPFLMGKPFWDNWLVGYLNTLAETISFANYSYVYHVGPLRTKYKDYTQEYFINYYIHTSKIHFGGGNDQTKWRIENGYLLKNKGNIKLLL